jgi:hypothetical protein
MMIDDEQDPYLAPPTPPQAAAPPDQRVAHVPKRAGRPGTRRERVERALEDHTEDGAIVYGAPRLIEAVSGVRWDKAAPDVRRWLRGVGAVQLVDGTHLYAIPASFPPKMDFGSKARPGSICGSLSNSSSAAIAQMESGCFIEPPGELSTQNPPGHPPAPHGDDPWWWEPTTWRMVVRHYLPGASPAAQVRRYWEHLCNNFIADVLDGLPTDEGEERGHEWTAGRVHLSRLIAAQLSGAFAKDYPAALIPELGDLQDMAAHCLRETGCHTRLRAAWGRDHEWEGDTPFFGAWERVQAEDEEVRVEVAAGIDEGEEGDER